MNKQKLLNIFNLLNQIKLDATPQNIQIMYSVYGLLQQVIDEIDKEDKQE
jgi:hypothetical protein